MALATPAEADAIKNRIGAILMSPSCQTIDFWLDGHHIDGSAFSYVALAMRSVTIDIEPNPPPNVAAGYNPYSNTFRFKSANVGTTLRERMYIVHESTHAMIDAKGKQATASGASARDVSNEACAYVAGMFYYVLESAGLTGMPVPPIWAASVPVHRTAFLIASTMRRRLGQRVSVNDANAMRAAILNDSVYADLRADPGRQTPNDGLPL